MVAPGAGSGDEWTRLARRVEALGYSIMVMPDTLGRTLAPLPALAAAAMGTSTLRLGTYVLVNDFRNPVLLAREAATLDLLSGGRFELGLGVGRPTAGPDYQKLGMPLDAGGVRVERLAEALPIVKALLAGYSAEAGGPYYRIEGADGFPPPIQQPRMPILIAGSGRRMLELAGRQADIVAIGAPPNESEVQMRRRIGWVREAAGARVSKLELNLNLIAVGETVNERMLASLGMDANQLARSGSPQVLLGSLNAMSETLQRRRESLGVSYLMIGAQSMEPFAAVVDRLGGR